MDTLNRLQHGHLQGAQRLDLACDLSSFPREIFDLADTLEVLNLSGNRLQDLPDDLPRLHRMKVLFCGDNQFARIPDSVGRCPQLSMVSFKGNQLTSIEGRALPPALRWLILTDNLLQELPDEIGHCKRLQKLMLAGNQLRALPASMQQCQRLELVRLSANRLTELPAWLLALPQLAWLAYGGNPLSAEDEAHALAMAGVRRIDWSELDLTARLGEGASGHIHQAAWRHEGLLEDIALKLFKGDMTSDGLPLNEMAAWVHAGAHPHLMPVHGVLQGHPDGRLGLVMPRIADDCQSVAAPPSLASCTRDVYPDDLLLDLEMVLRLSTAIARAVAHLHARGVLHGDLYAHNILWNQRGHCLLGDFGAASFLPTARPDVAQALTALEVRAFGHLFEELLARCRLPAHPPGMLARLHTLQARCVRPDPASRPGMAEIAEALASLSDDVGIALAPD
ncbi:MAG: leucine-rich repeat-containing protein kinase family protein [Aquabacterium sp.]